MSVGREVYLGPVSGLARGTRGSGSTSTPAPRLAIPRPPPGCVPQVLELVPEPLAAGWRSVPLTGQTVLRALCW